MKKLEYNPGKWYYYELGDTIGIAKFKELKNGKFYFNEVCSINGTLVGYTDFDGAMDESYIIDSATHSQIRVLLSNVAIKKGFKFESISYRPDLDLMFSRNKIIYERGIWKSFDHNYEVGQWYYYESK